MASFDADVDTWTKDWRRLRHQKHRERGGVEASMLLDYLLYEGEHQTTQVQNAILTRAFRHERDKNKLRLVINLARRAVDRKIGRHWSIAHRFQATPNVRDPLAYDLADIIGDQLIPATDYKLGQDTLRWQIYKWMVICGVAFEHVDYKDGVTQDVLPKYDEASGEILWYDELTQAEVPESVVRQLVSSGRVPTERFKPATEVQRTGDLGGDIYDPFRVFIDASVGLVKNLGPGQAIYLCDLRSEDWISDNFGADAINGLRQGKDLSIIETQLLDRGMPVSGTNLKDLLPLVHGSRGKDDPPMHIVITRYEPRCEKYPEGLRSFFIPDQVALDKGVNPYPEVPVLDYHWSAPGASMWTTGFVRDLQSMSRFLNKRYSQMGEAANAQIYEMLLLGGDVAAKDIPTDFPGVVKGGINDDTGAPNVQVVPRGNLPPFFVDSIRLGHETIDSLSSSDLLSQRKFPGQLRGSLTLPILQEILDSEDGPRFSHLGEQFAMEKMMRINRIKQFYPPIRTLNYTGDDNRTEVLELHTDELLRAGMDFTVTVDPGSITPELSAMREARIRERMEWAPGLYTNADTGTIDWSLVAQDLRYNDRQRTGIVTQGRKLARQFIRWARMGKITITMAINPQTQQPQPRLVRENGEPFVVAPFWPHKEMLDQYKVEMMTTEFLEASAEYRQVMYALYDLHRSIITTIDQNRQSAVDNKMMQGAVAQATQQAAAKAASTAANVALEQVMAQKENMDDSGGFAQMQSMIRQLMGSTQGESPNGTGPVTPQPRPGFGKRALQR